MSDFNTHVLPPEFQTPEFYEKLRNAPVIYGPRYFFTTDGPFGPTLEREDDYFQRKFEEQRVSFIAWDGAVLRTMSMKHFICLQKS